MSTGNNSFIPYGRQWIDEDDIDCVVKTLRGEWLTTGPAVAQFEAQLAQSVGCSHAVALNSGTSALHAAYYAAGLRTGDEIITTPLTFVATANAALYLGASVKFVDIDPRTGNIDPAKIAQAISPRTKLIVPVDFAGHPADYDAIQVIADTYRLRVVADAAHSLGGIYRGRKVGTLADLTEISLHPVKPITSAEGGAVLTNCEDIAQNAYDFRTHGIVRDIERMEKLEGPWHYEMHELGFNYRLTDIQCALGVSQLTKLNQFIERRRAIAAMYLDAFSDLDELVLPVEEQNVASGWHLFVVRVSGKKELRVQLFNRLRELNLGVQVHYMPVYWHPYYQRLGFARGLCPLAEDFYERAISLPMFPKMSDEDVQQVIERVHLAVNDVCR